jgi:hypothetical protein
VTDHTNDYSGTMDFSGASGFGAGASLEYAWTQEELLTNRGGTVNGSYTWEYGKSEVFTTFLKFKVAGGVTNYIETFNGQIPRTILSAPRPLTGSAELRQTMIRPDLTWAPWRNWRFNAGYEIYAYNHNVKKFVTVLDSIAFMRLGIGGFSNSIGGLPRFAYSGYATYAFAENWKFKLSETFAIIDADDTSSTALRGTLERKLGSEWRATLGAEWDNSSTGPSYLAIAGLEWEN